MYRSARVTSASMLALLAASLIAPASRAAQDQTETVPPDLLKLLFPIGGMRGEETALRVGSAPADFPLDVLPPGTAVGAATVSERATVVVGINPTLAAAQQQAYGRTLVDHGWTATGPPLRGFVRTSTLRPVSVCRDRDYVSLALVPREAGGSYVRVVLTRDPRRPCVARPTFSLSDVVIPPLTPPAGAQVASIGGNGSLDAYFSYARLQSNMSARDVADYYAKQLITAGWRAAGRTRDVDGMGVARLTGTSRAGAPVSALLLVTPLKDSSPATLDLFLRVMRD